MNTNDLIELSRSGSLFCAVTPASMMKLRVLRRWLAIDCPNTISQFEEGVLDEGLARCTNEALLFDTLFRFVRSGSQPHTNFVEDTRASPNVVFKTVADEFMRRSHVLDTKSRPAPCNARLVPTTDFGQDSPSRPTPKLRVAIGVALRSIGVIEGRLNALVPHRCAIQIVALPSVDPSAVEAVATKSPARFNLTTPIKAASPLVDAISVECSNRSLLLVHSHEETKHFIPHCAFGLYHPPSGNDCQQNRSRSLQDKAPFISSQWVGFYWMAGSSVPQIAIVAGVTNEGMPRVLHVKGTRILKEGDVLSIETTPHPQNVPLGGRSTCFKNRRADFIM